MFFPFQVIDNDCKKNMRLKMISEPSTADGGDGCSLIKGIQLSHTTKEFNVKKCILCQQHNKNHNATSGLSGRENIKRAATVRQDEKVCKRLKIVAGSQSKSFVYHLSKCYKSYTMEKHLNQLLNHERMRKLIRK